MTAEHSYAALRAYDQRIAGMLADPECVGELLLVGIGIARSLDFGDPPLTDAGAVPMRIVAEQVYGNRWLPGSMLYPDAQTKRADTNPYKRIRDVFHLDRRRYRPNDDTRWHAVTCGRPMVRRAGLCGRPASHTQRVTDPATGLRQWLGACSNRPCRDWLTDVMARNAADLAEHPAPQPAANTGGVLERHFPEIDWWTIWRKVDPKWTPPPEGRPFERPTLRLITVDPDGDAEAEPVVTARPALVVHQGGWR
jgi:hypothetical protein